MTPQPTAIDTQQKIPLLLRMSAFVPVGVVFVLGMLQPNPSLRTAVFWQWANQSSNALINYANRNATADDPDGGRTLRTMKVKFTGLTQNSQVDPEV